MIYISRDSCEQHIFSLHTVIIIADISKKDDDLLQYIMLPFEKSMFIFSGLLLLQAPICDTLLVVIHVYKIQYYSKHIYLSKETHTFLKLLYSAVCMQYTVLYSVIFIVSFQNVNNMLFFNPILSLPIPLSTTDLLCPPS